MKNTLPNALYASISDEIPEGWRMDDPPAAFDPEQPKVGDVDEVEIRRQLPDNIY